jgi:hypothetical protein
MERQYIFHHTRSGCLVFSIGVIGSVVLATLFVLYLPGKDVLLGMLLLIVSLFFTFLSFKIDKSRRN